MGYNLTIGEFAVVSDPAERYACGEAVLPEGADVSGAPLNSGNDHSHSCSPSYIVWHKFCSAVGLLSVFYAPRCPCDLCNDDSMSKCSRSGRSHWWMRPDGVEDGGLLERHPGVVALTDQHLIEFKRARERYMATPEPRSGEGDGGVDWNLRRLDWLIWWTEWALKNCEYPTFENS